MALKQDPHVFRGMKRDVAASRQDPEFLYEALNIRFMSEDDDTTFAITNEKGPSKVELRKRDIVTGEYQEGSIEGEYVGHCIIDDYCVLFTHGEEDHIYLIFPSSQVFYSIFDGDINLNPNNRLQTLGVYDNQDLQKVYWVDGVNQPRILKIFGIPVNKEDYNASRWKNYIGNKSNSKFDFVNTLKLGESISVEKTIGEGMFAPGVVQYAFAYYNKYGQESNIFYTTPLNYISFSDRAGSPEDKIGNAFKITIRNLDTNFEYLRVFSIHRTSIDATPTCKRVIDIKLSTETSTYFIDNGMIGDTIDPTELLYIGGEEIVASTITSKNNTLFLGNIKITRPSVPDKVKEDLSPSKEQLENGDRQPSEDMVFPIKLTDSIDGNFKGSYYQYVNTNNFTYPGFKQGEHYRLGLQFQYKTGKWSEPVWLGDYTVQRTRHLQDYDDIIYLPSLTIDDNKATQERVGIGIKLGRSIAQTLKEHGYLKVRPVGVFPNVMERLVLTQGMLCPTVYSSSLRKTNSPFVQSSWFLRPTVQESLSDISNDKDVNFGAWVEFRHNHALTAGGDRGAEIYNSTGGEYVVSENDIFPSTFAVDQSILTFHSPDIEFDDTFDLLDYSGYSLRLVGMINFVSSIGDIDIQITGAPGNTYGGFDSNNTVAVSALEPTNTHKAYRSLVSGLYWQDGQLHLNDDKKYEVIGNSRYLIYPWQRTGSLNNDMQRPADQGTRSAVLSKKKISNLKFSSHNRWLSNPINYGIIKPEIFNSDQVSLVKLPFNDNSANLTDINYYGNVDTMVSLESTGTWIAATNQFTAKTAFRDYSDINVYKDAEITSVKDAVRIKYKSSKHLIVPLKASANSQPVILPVIDDINKSASPNVAPYWLKDKADIPLYPSYDVGGTTITLDIRLRWTSHLKTLLASDPDFPVNKYYYIWGNDDNGKAVHKIWFKGERLIYDVGDDDNYINEIFPETKAGIVFTIDDGNIGEQNFDVITLGTEDGDAKLANEEDEDPDAKKYNPISTPLSSDDIIGKDWETGEYPYPYLFLGELYRDEKATDFGGTHEDALKSNLWVPIGEPVAIGDTDIEMTCDRGDTWYQRYDCLKTYPFTMEDENSIVEIGSFLCESRVNTDGRYDRNRAQLSNLVMSPVNFNLMNSVYSQTNNFFNYRILDSDYYNLSTYASTITWTLDHTPAADNDLWTNITLANVLNLDGTKGAVNALSTYKDSIFCFQDSAISKILYNERVQIEASDGVPIEISNSGKVDGQVYLFDTVGCTNKESIVITPGGVYFIDNVSKQLWSIGGESPMVISSNYGFKNWFSDNGYKEEFSFYDYRRNDLYLLYPDISLIKSDILADGFSSFMSYNNRDVKAMFNTGDEFYSLYSNKEGLQLFKMFGGEYNNFFGNYKDFYITFISNAEPTEDKIFTNVETRVAFSNPEIGENHLRIFDYIEAGDPKGNYQWGRDILDFKKAGVSNAKKKFKIWRLDIPRSFVYDDGFDTDKKTLQRIRDTWTKIKLGVNSNLENQNLKMQLNDVIVDYYI